MHENVLLLQSLPTAILPTLIISMYGRGISIPPHPKAHRSSFCTHKNELQQKEITFVFSKNQTQNRWLIFWKITQVLKQNERQQSSFCHFISLLFLLSWRSAWKKVHVSLFNQTNKSNQPYNIVINADNCFTDAYCHHIPILFNLSYFCPQGVWSSQGYIDHV